MATAPLLFIDWHPDPVMLRLGGFELHYYSILFALGLILAYLGAKRIYKDKGIAPDKLDPLFVYAFLGILVGARLGHCLFYEPGYYLSHPVEMLLPIRDTPTGWQFTGYQGLASHGGALGLIIALWLYVFLKDVQVDFERGMTLDMGQWLSIPFVIIGVACMIGGRWLDKIVAKAEFKDAKGKKNKK